MTDVKSANLEIMLMTSSICRHCYS